MLGNGSRQRFHSWPILAREVTEVSAPIDAADQSIHFLCMRGQPFAGSFGKRPVRLRPDRLLEGPNERPRLPAPNLDNAFAHPAIGRRRPELGRRFNRGERPDQPADELRCLLVVKLGEGNAQPIAALKRDIMWDIRKRAYVKAFIIINL